MRGVPSGTKQSTRLVDLAKMFVLPAKGDDVRVGEINRLHAVSSREILNV
jgi:hypothetical protein